MKKKVLYTLKILLITAILVFLWTYVHGFSAGDGKMITVYDWDVSYNDGEYVTYKTLEECDLGACMSGDTVEIKTVLEDYGIDSPILVLRVYHSVINVYLEDEHIYTYGQAIADRGEMTGEGRFFVEIPAGYVGKTLTVTLNVCEDDETSLISEGKVQNGVIVVKDIIRKNLFEIVLLGFIIFFVVLCISGFIINASRRNESVLLLYMAGLFISVGIWLYCYTGLSELVSQKYSLWTLVEYVSLFMTPVFMLLFVSVILLKKNVKIPLYVMAGLQFILLSFALITHFANTRHIEQYLQTFHMTCVASVVVMLICIGINFTELRRKSKMRIMTSDREQYIFVFGIIFTVLLTGFDIVRYDIEKYVLGNKSASFGAVTVAIVCLIVTMLITYISMLTVKYNENTEKRVLERLAYVDTLTQIPNRARCEEEINQLDKELKGGMENAAIIFLDLNKFKDINDTFGHSMGDDALKSFASLIEKRFLNCAFLGRMSGDEFIIIFRNASYETIENHMNQFTNDIEEYNRTSGKKYRLSTSYGIAYKTEEIKCGGWDLYKEADRRMYEMKVHKY